MGAHIFVCRALLREEAGRDRIVHCKAARANDVLCAFIVDRAIVAELIIVATGNVVARDWVVEGEERRDLRAQVRGGREEHRVLSHMLWREQTLASRALQKVVKL